VLDMVIEILSPTPNPVEAELPTSTEP